MQTTLSLERLASQHYENFPVALWILPKAWRKAIRLIYAFARQADDMADEGNLSPDARLAQLNVFWDQLCLIQNAETMSSIDTELSPFFQSLRKCIREHNLPLQAFFDLLTAFKQDVVKSSYADWDELLHYCQHSANPIGVLLLTLAKQNTADNIAASNAICTALQLLNFWQDVSDDKQQRNRCYIPLDEQNKYAADYRSLIQAQLEKTRLIVDSGADLPAKLKGAFGFQIRMVVVCAYRLLSRLSQRKDYYQRPVLRTVDWACIFFTTIYKTLTQWCNQCR